MRQMRATKKRRDGDGWRLQIGNHAAPNNVAPTMPLIVTMTTMKLSIVIIIIDQQPQSAGWMSQTILFFSNGSNLTVEKSNNDGSVSNGCDCKETKFQKIKSKKNKHQWWVFSWNLLFPMLNRLNPGLTRRHVDRLLVYFTFSEFKIIFLYIMKIFVEVVEQNS